MYVLFYILTIRTELADLSEKHANMTIADEGTIREYYETRKQIDTFAEDVQFVMSHPNHSLQFYQPGRVVYIKFKNLDFGWGVVVNYKERKFQNQQNQQNQTQEPAIDHHRYVLDVLLKVPDGTSVGTKTFQDLPSGVVPSVEGQKTRVEVIPVMLNCVQRIGHMRVHLPKDLKSTDSRNSIKKTLNEVQKRFPDGIPTIDPIEQMNIDDEGFKKNLRVSFFFVKPSFYTTIAVILTILD